MIRDRLAALRPFLAADASVWVHLDETMSHKARFILDDVFGASAYVATVVWQKRLTVEWDRHLLFPRSDSRLRPVRSKAWKQSRNRVPGRAEASIAMVTPRPLARRALHRSRVPLRPAVRHHQSSRAKLRPPRGRSWLRRSRSLIACSRKTGFGGRREVGAAPYEELRHRRAASSWHGVDCQETGTNDDAKRHLASLFPEASSLFDTPKPEKLLRRILHIATNPRGPRRRSLRRLRYDSGRRAQDGPPLDHC